MSISAIIIAKNEEKVLEDCLKSVQFCDEIVVIDTRSTDKTKEIAKKYNAHIFEVDFSDFSTLRNIGKEKAKGEWVFYIDADERVDMNLKESIKKIIKLNNDYVAYQIKRKNFYLGNHEWAGFEKLERLFKKNHLKKWHGVLHESAEIEGKIGLLDGYILHFSHRDLSSMLTKTILWSTTEATLRFNTNHPEMVWWRFLRVMITGFFDSYITQKGYKSGVAGLIEGIYQSFSMFITYAKLWEMQQSTKTKKE